MWWKEYQKRVIDTKNNLAYTLENEEGESDSYLQV